MFEPLYYLLSFIFYPLLSKLSPGWFITLISFLVTILSTLIIIHGTDQYKMKSMRKEIILLTNNMKKYSNDPFMLSQLKKEITRKNMKMMSYSIIPQILIIIPIIIFFRWLGLIFAYITPDKITPIYLFGWRPGWLAVYIITGIIWGIIVRKLIKVY